MHVILDILWFVGWDIGQIELGVASHHTDNKNQRYINTSDSDIHITSSSSSSSSSSPSLYSTSAM